MYLMSKKLKSIGLTPAGKVLDTAVLEVTAQLDAVLEFVIVWRRLCFLAIGEDLSDIFW